MRGTRTSAVIQSRHLVLVLAAGDTAFAGVGVSGAPALHLHQHDSLRLGAVARGGVEAVTAPRDPAVDSEVPQVAPLVRDLARVGRRADQRRGEGDGARADVHHARPLRALDEGPGSAPAAGDAFSLPLCQAPTSGDRTAPPRRGR
jgi:hypothetical protein